jgi:hypothetical protein
LKIFCPAGEDIFRGIRQVNDIFAEDIKKARDEHIYPSLGAYHDGPFWKFNQSLMIQIHVDFHLIGLSRDTVI